MGMTDAVLWQAFFATTHWPSLQGDFPPNVFEGEMRTVVERVHAGLTLTEEQEAMVVDSRQALFAKKNAAHLARAMRKRAEKAEEKTKFRDRAKMLVSLR